MMKRFLMTVGSCLFVGSFAGCANEVPDVEATFGTDGLPPVGTEGDSSGGGSPVEFCVQGDGSISPEVENPVRYQCNGQGGGELTWLQCGGLIDCGEEAGNEEVVAVFPPVEGDDLNAQACCEPSTDEEFTTDACLDDCARASCNEVIRRLEDRLAGDPPAGCPVVVGCVDRYEASLETWINFLRENYGDCLDAARFPDLPLILPNADVEQATGAAYNAVLTLDCTVDADAVESEDACTENENPELAELEGTEWTCGVTGFATLEEGRDTTTTTVSGTVSYRRGDCNGASECWFQVNELDLTADPVTGVDGTLRSGTSGLGYPVFGSYDTSSNEGSAGKLMLGMDTKVKVKPVGGHVSQYDVRIKNSEPTGFRVEKGFFAMKKADFSWSTGEDVRVEVTSTSCTQIGG